MTSLQATTQVEAGVAPGSTEHSSSVNGARNLGAELMELFVLKQADEFPQVEKFREVLLQFATEFNLNDSDEHWSACFQSSDPHSIASLLVQQLLSQFSTAFLANNGSSTATTADVNIIGGIGGGKEASSPHRSLKEFLCQDTPLLLMLAIQLVGQKVDSIYPELAELLVVVLRMLLPKSCEFTMDEDSVMKLIPFYELILLEPSTPLDTLTTNTTFLNASLREQRNSAGLFSASHHTEGYSTSSSSNGSNAYSESEDVARRQPRATSPKPPTSSSLGSRKVPSQMIQQRRKSSIVPREELKSILEALKKKPVGSPECVSERALYMLLLSVLESISFQTGTTLIDASLHLLQSITALFEEVVGLWFQGYGQEAIKKDLNSLKEEEERRKTSPSPTGSSSSGKGATSPPPQSTVRAYQGTMHIARIALRLWLQLFSQVLHSSPSPSQLSDIKPLLFSPLATVSKACYNLRQVGVFKGNAFLDHEFTLIILETLFSSLYAVNLYSIVPVCSIEDFFEAVRDTLTDGYQEWFTYLCSKLLEVHVAGSHNISSPALSTEEQFKMEASSSSSPSPKSNWPSILDYSHNLLSYILRELIVISSHIQAGQKASKLALASTGTGAPQQQQSSTELQQSSLPYVKPVSYSLEVATGFDKLTQRLSKIAQLLLDMFRTVPLIQLLSLQLLSETESDTVGTIGNFLSIISDPAVRSNSEVFDLYLELLENVWFRLSPDYTGSPSWWNKLSNYSTLLLESSCEVTCQVIYHLQCLFSHESTMLKSQITQHVVIPFHAHLMKLVKSKCYQKVVAASASSSTDGGVIQVQATPTTSTAAAEGEVEDGLSSDEKEIISVFLKLLLKVASNVHSLGTFTAESVNLYRLFLLFPLREFRSASFGVLDECLAALRGMTSSTCSSPNSGASSPTGIETLVLQPSDEGTMRRTIIRILLSLAYSVQKIEKIPKQCLAIAEGKAPLPKYGLAEADMVYRLIRTTFETIPLKQLLTPMFVDHLAVVADIWELLGRLAMQDEVVTKILNRNHIWDIVQVLAPSLCSLLCRVRQRLSREKDLGEAYVNLLKEHSVSLLSHLVTLAHFLCWLKTDNKALEIFCNDIQSSITGALVFTFPNGHLYCTALLKATCCFVPPLSFSSVINTTTPSHLAQPTSTSTSSPPAIHIKPSTPGSGGSGSGSVRATRTHGEPSSTGSGHSATMTNTATTQRLPTAGSFCSSDGALSPPPPSSSLAANVDTGTAAGSSSSRSHTPSKHGGSRPGGAGSSAPGLWKTGGGGGGGGGTGAASAFRPPQSQGIPIAAGASSRRGALRRQSSRRTNSFGGGSMGAAGILSSPFSGPGSFLRSAAIFSSQHSSLNSWSVWNSESFDSKFGRENHLLRWGGDGAPASASHSLRSWVWVRDPCESDLSGYEADVEHDLMYLTEVGESCDEKEESHLFQSLTTYLVPLEVQQRLWVHFPLQHCISLLRESLKAGPSENWEQCMEVFFYQFYALLKADPYNISFLSGKGLLELLLESFGSLFESTSGRSITCCRLLCHITEVLASHQISPGETRKLFLKLQASKAHLENLPSLLHSIVVSTNHPKQPSAYVHFSYSRPSQQVETWQMLTFPHVTSWGAKPRCISLWFSVDKYPLQAWVHLLTAFTGDGYLQIWACALSGDVITRFTSELQQTIGSTTESMHSRTLGSVITLGKWHHLSISVLPVEMQPIYRLIVLVNGEDMFQYELKLPVMTKTKSEQNQYFVGGGAVSSHTSERHISLVNATNYSISWKLGVLSILPGFSNPSLATILYHLGPNCASSNRDALRTIRKNYNLGIPDDRNVPSDTTIIPVNPVTDREIEKLLETPILFYSAHDPHKAYTKSIKPVREGEPPTEVPLILEVQWVLSASTVNRPQLLDMLHTAVGIDQIVYLYAKVVSEGCSEDVQCHVLSLLREVTSHSIMATMEFEQIGGMKLIQQVLQKPQAAVGQKIVDTMLTWCCGEDKKQVKDVSILSHVLLDWRIWHKASPTVWEKLLRQLNDLLSSGDDINVRAFVDAKAIIKILITSKERSLEKLPPLPRPIVVLFIRLVECLLGSPPQEDCLRYICDHLLVSDLNEVKFVSTPGTMDTSITNAFIRRASTPLAATSVSQVMGRNEGSISSEGGVGVAPSPMSPLTSSGRFSSSTVMILPESASLSDSEEVEEIEFNNQIGGEGCLPNSSYYEEDTLFTWEDITGQQSVTDGDWSEEIPYSMEVGLLGMVRKVITLMPDNMVRRVVGYVVQHEALIALAHNKSIIFRIAVVRVLDAYFKRGGDGAKTNFVQVKGFYLLGSQLKRYKVSSELMSALCSIVVGQDINLKGDQIDVNVVMPHSLSAFHMHAVVPVIQCLVNTIGQPQLCHSTICLLRELFETVKGMPAFMLNNGLLKVICQLISIVTDYGPLSTEEKELILNDVLQLCKLVVIFAISTDQEEMFKMMENLLVCVRHCYDELLKTKGPDSMSVIYLHQFQYHILTQALQYFHEDIQDSGLGGVASERSRTLNYVPTLPSNAQPPGQTDLTSRFVSTCNMAVEWAMYGVEPYTSEHAQYFQDEEVVMPTSIELDPEANIAQADVAFLHFLLNYFHRALQPLLRKTGTLSMSMERQRYSISSRTQLNDHMSRLLGHLFSPIHNNHMRSAVVKEFWALNDARLILNFALTSNFKKLLGSRLVIMITQLMKFGPQVIDTEAMDALNEIYSVVTKSNVTRLKSNTRLASLLSYEDERDIKQRQKYETVIDEMKNVDQRWMERYDVDVKVFSQQQTTHYSRLVEKARHRQQAIGRASASVTDRMFIRQADLRKHFIDYIAGLGSCERDMLQQWRTVIQLNTHPRALWAADEKRDMCLQLDPTEGPQRVRRRMMRAPTSVHEKHLLPEAMEKRRKKKNDSSPLSFIFENTAYHGMEGLLKKVVPQDGEEMLNNSLPWTCHSVSPDNCCKGSLVLSNLRCYFVGDEPLGDPNITKVLPSDEETTMLSWEHTEIVEIHKRRYMLKDNALEIFLINGRTLLFAFTSTVERNNVHSQLLDLDLPNLDDSGENESEKLKQVTQSWRQGEITNFEYLTELNKLAGRTFNDLMQYPVFPFILADYESQELDLRKKETFRNLEIPISIQDSTKKQKYLDTYKYLAAEAQNEQNRKLGLSHQIKPYHYGSHYSNSGIVLHFLVRLPPFTNMFLAFQGNSFDIADRTFRNVGTTWWLSSSESATDVKELIPEFYSLPEFLENRERFNFGECQDGTLVDNVILPRWAKNDPRLFVLKHRQALESEYVSHYLHAWVDLVFGFKQTGRAAVQAINVFHPATYYGADGIDIDSVTDPTQQAAMKAMVKTYGQMPLQLFREPHAPRTKSAVLTNFRMRLGNVLRRFTTTSPMIKVTGAMFWSNMTLHRAKMGSSSLDNDFIGAQAKPEPVYSHLASVDRTPEKMVYIGNGELIITEMRSLFFLSTSPSSSSLLVLWGTWDNSLIVRSAVTDTTSLRLHSHPFNKITCCECVCNGQMIVSGGSGGVVSFWRIRNTATSLKYSGKVKHLRGHDGPIHCLAACKPYSIVVTGSSDKTAIIWDTNRLTYVNTLSDHEGRVTVIATSSTLGDIATVCNLKTSKHSSKHASSCNLRMWTINGKLIERTHVEVQVYCLCYTAAPEGVYVNVLVGGLANGSVRVWSSWDLSTLRDIPCPLDNPPIPVLSIAVSSDSKELYAGYSSQQIVGWVKPKSSSAQEDTELFEHLPGATMEVYYTSPRT